jgi:hypothetical protein
MCANRYGNGQWGILRPEIDHYSRHRDEKISPWTSP